MQAKIPFKKQFARNTKEEKASVRRMRKPLNHAIPTGQ
jgi:hypothetical protein